MSKEETDFHAREAMAQKRGEMRHDKRIRTGASDYPLTEYREDFSRTMLGVLHFSEKRPAELAQQYGEASRLREEMYKLIGVLGAGGEIEVTEDRIMEGIGKGLARDCLVKLKDIGRDGALGLATLLTLFPERVTERIINYEEDTPMPLKQYISLQMKAAFDKKGLKRE